MKIVAFQKNKTRTYRGRSYYKYQVTITEKVVKQAGFKGVKSVKIVPDTKKGVIILVPTVDPITSN